MTNPDRLPAGINSSGNSGSIEQRATPRFALLLRAAKLVSPRGEFLCIVRDVSETGVKLRLFHSLIGIDHLALESATGERLRLDLVWEHNGEAGFRFVHPIDVQRFIAEVGPYPKRPIRIGVDHPARITVNGITSSARLRNISRQGAMIETETYLAIGQNFTIEADEMPKFDATVCWRRQPCYGLVFRQVMSLEELALLTFQMQSMRTQNVL